MKFLSCFWAVCIKMSSGCFFHFWSFCKHLKQKAGAKFNISDLCTACSHTSWGEKRIGLVWSELFQWVVTISLLLWGCQKPRPLRWRPRCMLPASRCTGRPLPSTPCSFALWSRPTAPSTTPSACTLQCIDKFFLAILRKPRQGLAESMTRLQNSNLFDVCGI